jgi:hypothetical protein
VEDIWRQPRKGTACSGAAGVLGSFGLRGVKRLKSRAPFGAVGSGFLKRVFIQLGTTPTRTPGRGWNSDKMSRAGSSLPSRGEGPCKGPGGTDPFQVKGIFCNGVAAATSCRGEVRRAKSRRRKAESSLRTPKFSMGRGSASHKIFMQLGRTPTRTPGGPTLGLVELHSQSLIAEGVNG